MNNRKIIGIGSLLLALLALAGIARATGSSPANRIIDGDRYKYVRTSASKLKVFTASKGMTVNQFVKKNKEIVAAINGTFFDKDSASFYPSGLVVEGGKLLWKSTLDVAAGKCRIRKSDYLRGKARSDSKWFQVFYTTKDGKAAIMPIDEFQEKFIDKKNLASVELAFEAGPRLLKNGKIQYDEFKNRPSRDKTVPRSVLGLLKNGEVIMFYSGKGYTLPGLSEALLGLGVVDAINLDGGSSSSFAGPGSKTKNVKVNTIFYVDK